MKRRQFLSLGAAAALPILPAVEAAVQTPPPGGNDLLRMTRDYHPMAFLQRVVALTPPRLESAEDHYCYFSASSYEPDPDFPMVRPINPIFTVSGYRRYTTLWSVDRTSDALVRRLNLPAALRYADVALTDPALTVESFTYGQNIRAVEAPGSDVVHWVATSPFARVYYTLPDGSRFVFKIGHEEPKACGRPFFAFDANGCVRSVTTFNEADWAGASDVSLRGTAVELALADCRLVVEPRTPLVDDKCGVDYFVPFQRLLS